MASTGRKGGASSGTLLAAGLGIAAVAAGVVAVALTQEGGLQRVLQSVGAGTGPAAKGARSGAASRRAAGTRHTSSGRSVAPEVARRRRDAWLAATNLHGLSAAALAEVYLRLRAEAVAGAGGDAAFERVTKDVDRDVPRTASVHPYAATPLFQQQLRNVLLTLALYDPDVGYVQGLNYIAAFLLVTMRDARGAVEETSQPDEEEADAFTLLVRLLNHPRFAMRPMFTPGLPGLHVLNRAMFACIEERAPAAHAAFTRVGLGAIHLHEYWFTLCAYVLPWHLLGPLWDQFMVEGWAAVARVVLGLLANLQPYLIEQSDADDISAVMTVLKSYAAHLTHGVGRGAAPAGGTPSSVFTVAPPDDIVAVSNKRFAAVTPAVFNAHMAAATAAEEAAAAAAAAAAADSTAHSGADADPPAAEASPASVGATAAAVSADDDEGTAAEDNADGGASPGEGPMQASALGEGPMQASALGEGPMQASALGEGPMQASALGESWLVVDNPDSEAAPHTAPGKASDEA